MRLLLEILTILPVCLAAICGVKIKESSSTIRTSRTSKSVVASSSPSPIGAGFNAKTPVKLPLEAKILDSLEWQGPVSPVYKTDTGLEINAGVYLVDLDNTNETTIAKYHDDGKVVIAYFSAGGWDSVRSDSFDYDGACVCGGTLSRDGCSTLEYKQDGWDAWWIDIHSTECRASAEKIMTARFQRAAAKGFDGVMLDNVDSYLEGNGKPHGNTIEDEVSYLQTLSKAAKDNGLLVGPNNGGGMLKDYSEIILGGFDFVVVESCRKFNECDRYDPFLKAGKPTYQFEYYNSVTSCPSLKTGQHLTVYSGINLEAKTITLSC